MVGKTFGHYEILELLGSGGMGDVYRARDQNLDRDIAIKVLAEDFAGDSGRMARFEREAKLLAALSHPNIAAVHSFEESDGVQFLVLELVEGESLKERLASGSLPVDQAVELGLQVADALRAAHQEGIVHRDLKPANVLITVDGRAKVLDFGIAKPIQTDASPSRTEKATDLTTDGTLIGTAPYMSPEQIRGEQIDQRADIWAFGCLLYEMITGRAAFAKNTVADTLAAVLKERPEPLVDSNPAKRPRLPNFRSVCVCWSSIQL